MKRRATASSKVAKARQRKAKRRNTAPRVDRRSPSDASLRGQLDQSRRELKEALEHQIATSEVLDLISRTPTNVQPVFDAIIESTVRLCDAVFGVVWRYDGESLPSAASHNFHAQCPRQDCEGLSQAARPIDRGRAGNTGRQNRSCRRYACGSRLRPRTGIGGKLAS